MLVVLNVYFDMLVVLNVYFLTVVVLLNVYFRYACGNECVL
jgi:hypothetical protein